MIKKIKYLLGVIAAVTLFLFPKTIFECKKNSSALNYDFLKNDTSTVIDIIGVGEMVLGSNYEGETWLPKNKDIFFQDVKKQLTEADVTVGSLEGPIGSSCGTGKICNDPSNCFNFRMPIFAATALKEAGFDFVNLANNHSLDLGYGALDSTRAYLKMNNICFAGMKPDSFSIIERKGVKIGFTAFSSMNNCYSTLDTLQIKSIIKEAHKKTDIVIAFFDAGIEGNGGRHVTRQDEIFFGRNTGNIYKIAHTAIDAGADVVYSVGTHVLRAVEIYKGKFISYSCGNFCVYGNIYNKGYCGITSMSKVSLKKNGSLVKAQIIPVKLDYHGVPMIDSIKEALSVLNQLMREDFPEYDTYIDSNGFVSSKAKLLVSDNYIKSEPKKINPVKVKTNQIIFKNKMFHVIAGSFKVESNALSFKSRLITEGYTKCNIINDGKGFYRVSILDTIVEEEANTFLNKNYSKFKDGLFIWF